ncbi:hypothetical protein PLICRDRAFT_654691 [Plicaturopsis crispa FD-325 SS-3]|nr:hypothetical protein PLICRDRAFT_654691 [Plicaturopsis crispa FD-325 SS-3]
MRQPSPFGQPLRPLHLYTVEARTLSYPIDLPHTRFHARGLCGCYSAPGTASTAPAMFSATRSAPPSTCARRAQLAQIEVVGHRPLEARMQGLQRVADRDTDAPRDVDKDWPASTQLVYSCSVSRRDTTAGAAAKSKKSGERPCPLLDGAAFQQVARGGDPMRREIAMIFALLPSGGARSRLMRKGRGGGAVSRTRSSPTKVDGRGCRFDLVVCHFQPVVGLCELASCSVRKWKRRGD